MALNGSSPAVMHGLLAGQQDCVGAAFAISVPMVRKQEKGRHSAFLSPLNMKIK